MGQLISKHSLGDKLGIKEVMHKSVLIKLIIIIIIYYTSEQHYSKITQQHNLQ